MDIAIHAGIETLVDGSMRPGAYTARWDGRDEAGRMLSGGVYIMRLGADGQTQTRKLILVR